MSVLIGGKHFFFDDEGLELRENLERIFHEPAKHGRPVLAPETPLEDGRAALWSPPVVSDDGLSWRLWYQGGRVSPLYAESEDGIRWRRPVLGLVKIGGSLKNNVVDLDFKAEGKSRFPVVAPNPSDGEKKKRYCGLVPVSGTRLNPIFSEDGIKWRFEPGHPGVPSNDQYRLFCDRARGLLIATVKLYGYTGRDRLSVPEHGRSVGLFTSPDGLKWKDTGLNFYADHADRSAGREALAFHSARGDYRSPIFTDPEYSWTDVYCMPVFAYNGLYLGLPAMFHHSGYFKKPNQDGLIWPALAWSRDLKRWSRPERRKPFLPLSPCVDRDIYDNGMIFCSPPVRRGKELWFYYTGTRTSHCLREHLEEAGVDYAREKNSTAVFLARLRVDGFASLRAGEKKGAVLTKPMVVDGPRLRVNGKTSAGEIAAELRDARTGRVIPGFGLGDYSGSQNVAFSDGEKQIRLCGVGARHSGDRVENDADAFSGDEVDACMSWKGGCDISALKGKKVRVFFGLRNADIYSFWFGE